MLAHITRSSKIVFAGLPLLDPLLLTGLMPAAIMRRHLQGGGNLTGSAHLLAGPEACEGDADALDVHGGGDHAAPDVLGDVVAKGVAQVR